MADTEKRTQMGVTGHTPVPRATGAGPAVTPPGTAPPGTAPPGAPSQPPIVVSSAAGGATSYLPPTVDRLLGQTLAGRYVIEKKLGEGGMGAVYLATHNVLEKKVALKVLHGEYARKADLVERFMGEAKAASRIRHENVIDISDFGQTPDGLVFFAMELLKGHDLHEEITRARLAGDLLPWARTKKIFLQICAALAAAHALGIVHRDLKPENVYLVEFLDDPDFVKLLDFGIAKQTEVAEGDRKLTKTGMLFGTPEYMSPEQARGDTADHRVDIYAMACILFQMITGQVPFQSDNFMGVLSQHLTEPPPMIPPEVFERIGAPPGIAELIDRGLEKNRELRWQTIDDFANAIRVACGDPPKTLAPAPRMANVAAPGPTTVPASRTTGAPSTTNAALRQRTAWTGAPRVPTAAELGEPAKPRASSRLPLVLGAAVVLGGGGAAAAFFLHRGASTSPAPTPIAGAGSAAPTPPPTPTPTPIAPPPPAVEPAPAAPPAHVQIRLSTTPAGALVVDTRTGHPVGRTPVTFDLSGSREPRQYAVQLRGYGDRVIELVPDRDIDYPIALEKGAAGAAPVVERVPARGGGGPAGTAAATVPSPGAGSAARPTPEGTAPATRPTPDGATPTTRPTPDGATPTTRPTPDGATTRPEPPPPRPEPGPEHKDDDDTMPVLKTNVPGLGSGG